jgi:hypothetical protein
MLFSLGFALSLSNEGALNLSLPACLVSSFKNKYILPSKVQVLSVGFSSQPISGFMLSIYATLSRELEPKMLIGFSSTTIYTS